MSHCRKPGGFTLIEVILAVGIFTFAILALLGLFGSSLRSVGQVEDASRVPAVMGAVQAWIDGETFADVYTGVANQRTLELLCYVEVAGSGTSRTETLRVLRIDATGGDRSAFSGAAGAVFKADLIASPMNPDVGSALPARADTWAHGYVAMDVSIYTLPAPEPGESLAAYLARVGAARAPAFGQRADYERFHAVTYPAAKTR